jgi:hypothetical protein
MRTAAILLFVARLVDAVPVAAGGSGRVRSARLDAPHRVDVDMLDAVGGDIGNRLGRLRRHEGRPPALFVSPTPDGREAVASQSLAGVDADLPPFTVIRATNLRAAVPQPFVSTVAEPCAAKAGPAVFVTGNVFAASSTDSGATFRFLDPAAAFPPAAGGFCCDQSVLYDPGRDLFLWALLYFDDGTTNTLRLAVAHGAQDLAAGRWEYHDITPRDVLLPGGRFLDYPQLALGTNHLYLTANAFRVGVSGKFTDALILRLGLDDLAAGAAPSVDFYGTNDGHFTFTPVQSAGTIMYWAAHDPKRFALRLYRWSEGSLVVRFSDLAIAPYARGTEGICPGPDGRSWCGGTDDRIQTGWLAGGILGFMWNAPQAKGRSFPYLRVVRIDEASRHVVDEPDLFSTEFAIQHPAVAVNARGDLAGVVAFGGGARHPSVAGFIAEGGAPPWNLRELAMGDSGPLRNRWGDFFCARPDYPDGMTWVLSGHVLRGGGSDAFTQPYLFRVGLMRDVDCSTEDLCADDSNPCTADVCEGSVCTHPLRDGLLCDDGDQCTTGDLCREDRCVGGPPPNCIDADPCTVDRCAPTAGCLEEILPGIAGPLCRLDQGLALADCSGETIPRAILKSFQAAGGLVHAAAAHGPGIRQVRRARRLLNRAARRVPRPHVSRRLSRQCVNALETRLREVSDLLEPLTVTPRRLPRSPLEYDRAKKVRR